MEKNWEIVKDYGTVDSEDNKVLSIRKVSWYGKDPKLEIGMWFNGADMQTPDKKRITFMTKQGPHRLTEKMVDLGYGDTEVLQNSLDRRSTEKIVAPTDEEEPEEEQFEEEEDSDYFSSKDILD